MLVVNNELMRDLIKTEYTLKEIQAITNFLQGQQTFTFPTLKNGLFPAAIVDEETAYTGYANVWVRDNIHIAYAHYVSGKTDIAIKNVNALMSYFKKHKIRFENIIKNRVNLDDIMERPHIRFDGNNLSEIKQKWSHAQNDALGYFLWFYSKLAREGLIIFQGEDLEILALFPLYFEVIHYWQDEDNGHWEETRKIEASSIGVVIAGLKEFKKLLSEKDLISSFKYQEKNVSINFLEQLINQGIITLNAILPWECIQPKFQKRRYDSALLFLIYPLQIIDEEMAEEILSDVINNLQGNYGIKRYLGDSFWAADYKEKLPPEARTTNVSDDMSYRDVLLKEGEEAQWCIFDPIISVIYGLKFQKNYQQKYLEKQTHYLNRSLGQLTSKNSPLGELKCPELYYLEKGDYVPNDATPLLWTQANLKIALKRIEQNLLEIQN